MHALRRFRLLLAALVVAIPLEAHSAQSVLLIIFDDIGVANIAPYGIGAAPPPTPHIDHLARQGVLFRNAWSNPLCSPTRACIQTGRHCFRTGVGTNINSFWGQPLADDETTLPELFPHVPSAVLGKWHLGRPNDPASVNRHGYQHFQGTLLGFPPSYYLWPYTQNGKTSVAMHYAPSTNIDDAVRWIESQTGDWFACVALNSAHTPFHNPPPDLHTYRLTGSHQTDLNQYKAAIQAADTELGRLLDVVNLDEATIVLVSDNGTHTDVIEPPFDPQHSKYTVYQGGVWVPLIIAGRSVAAGGREVAALVHVTDLFATIADLMGAPQTTGADSVSLVPYLQNPRTPPLRLTNFCEVFGMTVEGPVNARAMRDQRFKLLQQKARPPPATSSKSSTTSLPTPTSTTTSSQTRPIAGRLPPSASNSPPSPAPICHPIERATRRVKETAHARAAHAKEPRTLRRHPAHGIRN